MPRLYRTPSTNLFTGSVMIAAFLILCSVTAFAQQCELAWTPDMFGLPGTDDIVYATAVFDDGHGPALYVGGAFTKAGDILANHIAKWDGTKWSPLGSGTTGNVYALTVFDDGTGPALYAGGDFGMAGGLPAHLVAKWDGAQWSPLGDGMYGRLYPAVYSFAAFDDGSGPALYAGGLFSRAGGVSVNSIAKWDGTQWSAPAGGMNLNAIVYALTVFDPPGADSGPALYAGGDFSTAGAITTSGIARWDGKEWSDVGGGTGASGDIYALAVFDDGTGPGLYAGGYFGTVGGVQAMYIARWDGAQWSAVGGGMSGGDVRALAVLDLPTDPGGPALYAGGSFATAGGVQAACIAKWDGTSWSAMEIGMSGLNSFVSTMAVYAPSGAESAPVLFAGGKFAGAGGRPAGFIARWDAARWLPLNGGLIGDGSPVSPSVRALAVFDPPGTEGPTFYAGGNIRAVAIDGASADGVAQWNGTSWSPLGEGLSPYACVYAMTVFDPPGAQHHPALYVGGFFTSAGGTPAANIAAWDGIEWSALGGGTNGSITALAVFDDGTGPALFAAGQFTTAGDVPVNNIARWDGSHWSDVGGGTDNPVLAFAVFDDGNGPALYAAGSFTTVGGVQANRIAKWDGTQWSSLGDALNGYVLALAVFDPPGPEGPSLYAGGHFTTAGDLPANYIARWNGTQWSALGAGESQGTDSDVYALTVFDDSTGPALYVGGGFLAAGGLTVNQIARWDGTQWSALGAGIEVPATTPLPRVRALTVFDLPGTCTGPALYAGGYFTTAGGFVSAYMARWGRQTVLADLDCDADADGFDFLTFADCYNGSDRPLLAACRNPQADFDDDHDVDGFDFLTFANCYNGSDRPPLCP